ncbi:hypothetical protein A8990_106112 [Paenibacillus taihuensis]|uniref:Uncharacterized protein n=1 Tax=Paenibacillus taihuensis TaxID=1156355 RepID=A0A3D9SBF7_9BACL|nr:hypothetical protein A8990_106112 [Paenibacillus taihuensis]
MFFHQGMLHPVTLAFKYEQMAAVRQPVDHGHGHLVVGEDGAPFGELEIGGNDKAAALVAVGYHAEEQLRAFLVNGL